MKRSSLRATALLTLPCVFILAAGIAVTRWREKERVKLLAFYSQPFKPQLQLKRGKVPGYTSPGLFEVQANCVSLGGRGQSQWLLNARLVKVGGKSSPELWNSQKLPTSNLVSVVMKGSNSISVGGSTLGAPRPSSEAMFFWRFSRLEKSPTTSNLRLKPLLFQFPFRKTSWASTASAFAKRLPLKSQRQSSN